MLAPARAYAQLTTRASAWGQVGRATGERADVDYAAALTAGLDRRLYLAGRVHYCRDWAAVPETVESLRPRITRLAKQERWKDVPRGTLEDILWLSVIEHCDPSLMSVRRMLVGHCQPKQLLALDDTRVAWLGLTDREWRDWRPRFQAAYDEIQRWVDVAASHINHAQDD